MCKCKHESCFRVFGVQVLLGWKHGETVDEKAKTHPMLRSYKSLTEKVQTSPQNIQRDLIYDSQCECLCVSARRRRRFTAGRFVSP